MPSSRNPSILDQLKLYGGELSAKERRVVEMREGDLTFREIGTDATVSASREYAYQIYVAAVGKLKRLAELNADKPITLDSPIEGILRGNTSRSLHSAYPTLRAIDDATDDELLDYLNGRASTLIYVREQVHRLGGKKPTDRLSVPADAPLVDDLKRQK